MASLYKRARSPYWWLKWRQADGTVCRESTGFRFGIASENRKAQTLRAEKEGHELRNPQNGGQARWEDWVPQFLKSRYGNRAKTFSRYSGCWRSLRVFLLERDITSPAMLKREDCLAYPAWRMDLGHANAARTKRGVTWNTARQDLKTLSLILNEAVQRRFIDQSPAWKLNLHRDPPRVKSLLSDEHVAIIREDITRRATLARTDAAKARADFFRVSFELAYHCGMRMFETYFPLEAVDWRTPAVELIVKGNKRERRLLNPAVLPLLLELKAKGQTHTYRQEKQPGLLWFFVFDRLRKIHPSMKDVSFHSTRVNFISRGEAAGIPEQVMMDMVGHSMTTVHRVYRRFEGKEYSRAWLQVNGSLDGHKPPAP